MIFIVFILAVFHGLGIGETRDNSFFSHIRTLRYDFNAIRNESLKWNARSFTEVDRRKSLFGHEIIPGKNGKTIIISAPSQKLRSGIYAGEVFECNYHSNSSSCISVDKNRSIYNNQRVKSGVLRPLYGIAMDRVGDYILICQGYSENDSLKDYCKCVKLSYSPESTFSECSNDNYYLQFNENFYNVLLAKYWGKEHTLFRLSRCFHSEDIYSKGSLMNDKYSHPSYEMNVTDDIWSIPTLALGYGYIFTPNDAGYVFATNDDLEQRGKLFIHDTYTLMYHRAPRLVIDNPTWEPFANFGEKIRVLDVNKDKYADILVSSPTATLNGLNLVGIVYLFINKHAPQYFDTDALVIHGKIINYSYFGFNIETAGDLNGDGVTDFYIAALKVDVNDINGGIYIFFGRIFQESSSFSYYEILRPLAHSTTFPSGFGFAIHSEVEHDTNDEYLFVSRVFEGEVDVYKQKRLTKPQIEVKKLSAIMINEDFMNFGKEPKNMECQICFHNLMGETIKYMAHFVNSPNFISFSHNTTENHVFGNLTVDDNECVDIAFNLKPWSIPIPLKLALLVNVQQLIFSDVIFVPSFLPVVSVSEINVIKYCRHHDECIHDIDVKLLSKFYFVSNSEEPAKFQLGLTNLEDFLGRMTIIVELSLPCQLSLSNNKIEKIRDDLKVSHYLYNEFVLSRDIVLMNVNIHCPVVVITDNELVLSLTIESLFPHRAWNFNFRSVTKNRFTVEANRLPIVQNVIEVNTHTAVMVEFDVKLKVRGPSYDHRLKWGAKLLLGKLTSENLVNFRIDGNDEEIAIMKHNIPSPPTQHLIPFRILKISSEGTVQFKVIVKLNIQIKENLNIYVIVNHSKLHSNRYSMAMKDIMINEARYQANIAVKSTERLILISSVASCIAFLLCVGLCFILYINKFHTKLFNKSQEEFNPNQFEMIEEGYIQEMEF